MRQQSSWALAILFALAFALAACGGDDSPVSPSPPPPPPACQTHQTATITVKNETGHNAEVLIDDSTVGLLLPGESKIFTITAVTMHDLIVRDPSSCFLGHCSQCQWNVSRPVCSTQTYVCT